MMNHTIEIEKTAHYYSLGELNKQTNEIWIVCHGYGQLASFFIKKFQELEKPNRYIVAPEGLNKFYLKGFNGRVGASWMTKEKRLDEINDHCNYLEKLTDYLTSQAAYKCKIKVLGFSQGTATVSRWLLRTKHTIETLILWGGKIANDFNFKLYNQKHSNTRNFLVFGAEDEFYTVENVNEYRKELNLLKAEWMNYKGGHTIDAETLKVLENKLA